MRNSYFSSHKVQMLVEGAVMVALAFTLSMVAGFRMPQGGSVTAGSMLPIVLFAVRWGWKLGLFVGLTFALVQLTVSTIWFVNIPQFMFDYILPFMLLGMAGVFFRKKWGMIAGAALGGFLRFLSHFIAGIAFWGQYAPADQGPWLYSLLYNGTYMLPEIMFAAGVAAMLARPLERVVTGHDLWEI